MAPWEVTEGWVASGLGPSLSTPNAGLRTELPAEAHFLHTYCVPASRRQLDPGPGEVPGGPGAGEVEADGAGLCACAGPGGRLSSLRGPSPAMRCPGRWVRVTGLTAPSRRAGGSCPGGWVPVGTSCHRDKSSGREHVQGTGQGVHTPGEAEGPLGAHAVAMAAPSPSGGPGDLTAQAPAHGGAPPAEGLSGA